jgi:hypothetical protein
VRVEFVASGSPRVVARAVEEYARAQGLVSAIVVPWESTPTMLSMSVTSVRADGWAIEHTNLGTIRLIDAGNERTEVVAVPDVSNHPDQEKLSALFGRFVGQIQTKFGNDRAEASAP